MTPRGDKDWDNIVAWRNMCSDITLLNFFPRDYNLIKEA